MLKVSTYNTIKERLKKGIYCRVRLIKVSEDNSRETIIPFNSFGQPEAKVLERLDYIKSKLTEKDFPSGDYLIECSTGNTNNALIDSFQVKKQPYTIAISSNGDKKEDVEDHTNKQETMAEFDIDEYKEMVKQIAKLEANEKVLLLRIDILEKEKAMGKNSALSESAETTGSKALKILEDNGETILGLIDKYFTQNDKKLDLERDKLKSGRLPVKKKKSSGGKKKAVSVTYDDVANEMEQLMENDPDEFNKGMEKLETENPELYNYICEKLDLEVDEEEESEEEEEEEEEEEN